MFIKGTNPNEASNDDSSVDPRHILLFIILTFCSFRKYILIKLMVQVAWQKLWKGKNNTFSMVGSSNIMSHLMGNKFIFGTTVGILV